jgi:hypothetical protein
MTPDPNNQNINYLQGQIQGLNALVLALANLLLDPEEFRAEGLLRLQAERDAALAQPISDLTLAGIDAIETWLLNVT